MRILQKMSAGIRAADAYHAFSTGDYVRAIRLLEKQIAEDPIANKQESYYQLGVSYLKTGNAELAVRNLATAFSLYTDIISSAREDIFEEFVETGIAYGRALEQSNQHDLAIEVLESVKRAQANKSPS